MSGNLFSPIPKKTAEEVIQVLVQTGAARIERILSFGQASPADFWYDQDEDEFVAVLSGSAGLAIENRPGILDMKPGDWILLPARTRHRVEYTANPTVWLAIFF